MRKLLPVLFFLALLTAIAALSRHNFWNDSSGPAIALAGSAMAKPVYSVHTTDKVVALSFDDGPDPRYTLPVLKILGEKGARATFFVVGCEAEKHPEIIREAIKQGNEVANHTWTHPDLRKISNQHFMDEVKAANLLIGRLTGRENILFRPPQGIITLKQRKDLDRAGYVIVLWSICIESRKAKTPDQMAKRVLENIRPGEIILMHDGRLNRSKTVLALPLLLDGLKQKGYRTVTVEELLKKKNKESE